MSQLKKLRKSIKYLLIIALIQFILFMVKIFPWPWTSFICGQMGKLAFYLVKGERLKTLKNLTIAYGAEKSESEIKQMAKEVFENLGRAAAEAAIKMKLTEKEKYFSNVEVVGLEHAQAAFNRGKGILNIVPHIGCWEAASKAYTLLGFPAGAVAKPFKNDMLNNWVMKHREINGFKIFPRGTTYKTLLLHLKNNNSLGMLMDQDTSVKGVFVDFYGKPAYTSIGTAMLALDADASVFVASYVRSEGHKYKFIFDKPMDVIRTGDRKEELQLNSEQFQKAVERQIKNYPTQWTWMHERWKTTPEMITTAEQEKMRQRQQRKEIRLRNGID